ncbi:hypothetical protein [Spiroplasma endosymbiont of Aspidapion aeneum]|uniref:hypothetical protein n=1 Tax=Spiroplasma endosymbiont of Aspidapion aeneum TaxID=3066276 RepID=UPI00313AE60B
MKNILKLFASLTIGSTICTTVTSCGQHYIAINVANISSLDEMKKINKKNNIEEVNAILKTIVVTGVEKMTAEVNNQIITSVIVTVTPKDGFYILDQMDHFDINNAIKAN